MSVSVAPIPPADDLALAYPAVVKQIARAHRVRRATAAKWLHEALRFMDVVASTSEQVAPSKRAGRAWHAFILHTRDYERWCHGRYGRFIHHDPPDKPRAEAYARGYELMRERFGRLDGGIWPNPYGGGGDGG